MKNQEPDHRLALLQQWVYQCITHPAGVAQGAQEAAQALSLEQGGIPHLIKASATLSAADRLAIYHNAYYLRLMGVLEAEYPALKLALGDVLFGRFALFYLQQNPPHSHTLHELSAQLPDFLAASVPREDADAAWPNFIIDLVRMERTFQEVYRGPGLEGKTALQISDLPPIWKNCGVNAAPCFRLLKSLFPVHQYVVAARNQSPLPLPDGLEPTWLALCRSQYQVRIYPLSNAEYNMLEALNAGKTFQEAGVETLETVEKWMGNGFFANIATHGL